MENSQPKTQKVELPKYVLRALDSKLAKTEPYNWLTSEEWKELAEHMFEDELIPQEHTGKTYLPRGVQNAYGHGRRQVLEGILCTAIIDHKGVQSQVPYHFMAEQIYNAIQQVRKDRAEFCYAASRTGIFAPPKWAPNV